MKKRDVLEIVELLRYGSEIDEEKLTAMLIEYFGIAPDENRAYKELHAVVKERGGSTLELGRAFFAMKSRDDHRRRAAAVRLINALRERQSWKHPLAGFVAGPSQAEGGPVSVVKEANPERIRQTLEKNLVDGVAKFKVGPVIVHQSVNGDFWRLETPYPVDGFQLAVHWASLYAYETNSIESAVEHIARAMDAEAATKERKAEHPLARFAGSWSGSAGETVQT